MKDLFKTYEIKFYNIDEFNKVLDTKLHCLDVSYSEMTISFETKIERNTAFLLFRRLDTEVFE